MVPFGMVGTREALVPTISYEFVCIANCTLTPSARVDVLGLTGQPSTPRAYDYEHIAWEGSSSRDTNYDAHMSHLTSIHIHIQLYRVRVKKRPRSPAWSRWSVLWSGEQDHGSSRDINSGDAGRRCATHVRS